MVYSLHCQTSEMRGTRMKQKKSLSLYYISRTYLDFDTNMPKIAVAAKAVYT